MSRMSRLLLEGLDLVHCRPGKFLYKDFDSIAPVLPLETNYREALALRELKRLFRLPPNEAGNALELIRQLLESNPGICEQQDNSGKLPLHTAVECGCALPVLELLKSFYPEALTTPFHEPGDEGWLPLHYACCFARPAYNLEVFKFLAPTQAVLLSRDELNDSLPLHYYCCRYDVDDDDDLYVLDVEVLELLTGGDRDSLLQTNKRGCTPLHLALDDVVPEDMPAIQWLVNKCPAQALMIRERGFTPLHMACFLSQGIRTPTYDEIIRLLVNVCPEAAETDLAVSGSTVLHLYCSDSPDPLTLQALLQACPRNAHVLKESVSRVHQGKFPVEIVCRNFHDGNLDTHQLVDLIDAFGSDLLTIRDTKGKTVLHRAIDSSLNVDIVGILATKFISLLEGNHEGGTVLHYLCQKTPDVDDTSDKVAYLEVLVAASELAVLARNGQGKTPLHLLCSNETVTAEQLRVLATGEHVVSACGPQGETALHILCSNNNVSAEHLQALLQTFPALAMMQDDIGQLPLHKLAIKDEAIAAKPMFKAALRRLLAAFPGAINAEDAGKRTPLELACCDSEAGRKSSLNLVYELFRFDPVASLSSRGSA